MDLIEKIASKSKNHLITGLIMNVWKAVQSQFQKKKGIAVELKTKNQKKVHV